MAAQREAAVTHPYGAFELKLLYTHHLSFGLSSGIVLILTFIVIYCIFLQLRPAEPKGPETIIKIETLHPPTLYPKIPSTNITPRPTIQKNAIPVPVPDSKVDPNQTIPDQMTLSQEPNPLFDNTNPGDIIIKEPPVELAGPEPGMNEWQSVEIFPQVVRSIKPDYPEIAIRSMIEGKVVVKVLVDKAGKVRKTAVTFTDNEVFNQSALDAAGQYVFTPGMMSSGPVPVWVTLRFEFKLR
jgi:TonB family protein